MHRTFARLFTLLFVSILSLSANEPPRPNILLIVADDLGFSDLGCYGGEIDTPALDHLASEGLRFTEYHVNPMCVVTRTSLMTGHTHSQSDHYRRSLPIPKLLAEAGYHTSLSGKWHQPANPLDQGFHSFYGFLQGQIDSWNGHQRGGPTIQRNREVPHEVAAGWYASDAFTDDAIAQIKAAQKAEKPFFTYLAYNAPHSPLHAPRENVEKYPERYLEGWEKLRQKRFHRMREMGLLDDRYQMSEPTGEVRRWNELSPEVQQQESHRMAAYAGMVDRMDWNIGRLLEHLDGAGLAEDTLVLFFSDNGGDYSNGNIRTYDQQTPWQAGTSPYASNGWSYLKNTPFRWHKSCAMEGGVSSPLIVRWPAKLAKQAGKIRTQRLHVTDLYPTFLELAGKAFPEQKGARKLAPLYGQSLLPLFDDPDLPPLAIHDEMFWAFNQTGKGLTKGNWKVSSISDGPWMLFNIAIDPAESNNLAASHPEKLKKLSDAWFDFAQNETAMPPDWRAPLKNYQEGWGFHRVRMVLPHYQSNIPHNAQLDVPLDTDLSFTFSKPISFSKSKAKTIRLYSVADIEQPIWQADPEPNHPAVGKKTITFTDLPQLKPNTTYFILADPGWITVGGKAAGPLNDGAYWLRFRTAGQN
jgi:arylsulfatase